MTEPVELPEVLAEMARAVAVPPGFAGERPYVVCNMVQSVDGRATLQGRAGPLGSPADQALLEALRARADGVLVGAGTVRAEGYGELISSPELRAERAGRGQPERPVACVVSGALALDPESELLANPELEVLLLTTSPETLPPTAASVGYVRDSDPGSGDRSLLEPVLTRLRSEHGIDLLVCEGGPTLNASLLREGLIDELFLAISPRLVGGPEPLSIVAAEATGAPASLELAAHATDGEFLFVRYKVAR